MYRVKGGEGMAQHDSLAEKNLSRGINEAYLLRLNQYALDHQLIPESVYHELNMSIRTDYDQIMAKKKTPSAE